MINIFSYYITKQSTDFIIVRNDKLGQVDQNRGHSWTPKTLDMLVGEFNSDYNITQRVN